MFYCEDLSQSLKTYITYLLTFYIFYALVKTASLPEPSDEPDTREAGRLYGEADDPPPECLVSWVAAVPIPLWGELGLIRL